MAKRKRRVKRTNGDGRISPTPETMARAEFESAGMAYRRIAVIDTMLKRGQITERQHAALGYYRDTASTADDDAKRMSVMAPERPWEAVEATPEAVISPSIIAIAPRPWRRRASSETLVVSAP